MNEEMKELVGNQAKLREILGVGRTQSWKLWNNHSVLTASNEKLIRMTLEAECKQNK